MRQVLNLVQTELEKLPVLADFGRCCLRDLAPQILRKVLLVVLESLKRRDLPLQNLNLSLGGLNVLELRPDRHLHEKRTRMHNIRRL